MNPETSDTDEPRLLDYRNRVDAQVHWTSYPSESPSQIWRLVIEGPIWGSDDVVDDLYDAVISISEGRPLYAIRDQRNITSWGAAGGGEIVLLLIAESALGQLAAIAIWAALQGLRKKYRARGQKKLGQTQALDRDGAEHLARWHLESAFSLDDGVADTLDLLSEDVLPPEGNFQFAFQNDADRFSVTLHSEDGLPLLAELKREVRLN